MTKKVNTAKITIQLEARDAVPFQQFIATDKSHWQIPQVLLELTRLIKSKATGVETATVILGDTPAEGDPEPTPEAKPKK